MDLTTLAAIIRMLERSLIVVGGITAIFLGYKLFVLGIGNTQGEASAFGIELKNFGPGLFFAALGAVILITTMQAAIKVGPAEVIGTQHDNIQDTAKQNAEGNVISNAAFFGMEDTLRKNNKWSNTSFFLDTRQLLQRLENNEPLDSMADLRYSLSSKLESITMSNDEYQRFLELTSKIPLNESEQSELLSLEEKLFPYDKGNGK